MLRHFIYARLVTRTARLALACAAVVVMSGCAGRGPTLFVPPEVQRERLKRFDPYPDQDIGPPMVGVRPPDFISTPEGERAFWGIKRPGQP